MSFVRNDHNVAPLRQQRVNITLDYRQELLDGGKDNAAGCNLQQLPQICPSACLHRGLTQEFAVIGKGAE